MNNESINPIILTILDGWGHSEETKGNAIKLANTPTIDKILQTYPNSLLSASGKDVGLPDKQMGNSEVGHTTIGAGRIINQDLVRIQKSIENKEFFTNSTVHNICKKIEKRESTLHILGLCSDGGVHSHIQHLKALISIITKYKNNTCLHLITDGRDTEPKIATVFIQDILNEIEDKPHIKIATISGRYYSMDRDCRWARTEKAYTTLTENSNIKDTDSIIKIIENYYNDNISDEFIPPTRVNVGKISNNDGILFFNFRQDRIRQLLHSLAKNNFKGFKTKIIENLSITTFTQYDSTLNIPSIFPAEYHSNFLGQIIANNGLKQLRLAETEKYAHVTYFFNGGIEEPFPGEDRELIPSPKVQTYDLQPEMSAHSITQSAINAIDKNIYKIIIINYANPDMIGHTGELNATIEAIEVVDKCIEKIFNKTKECKGTLIITADHGNADYMIDKNNQPCKSHSTNAVPFILISNDNYKLKKLKSNGCLADIAPTILEILQINTPKEMNGNSLIIKNNIKTLI
uniref:2,3-bisphosphoglycerate-independent phosphoglycerate mutase n=1 Tax=Dasya naccarioides TaxID=2007180 RepID=A0A1Z1MGD1_9FLOR|nr:phosphoglycerate mutase [Dasya naccarioides]ARW65127.1 phosphoglycerate mutase [Dasya naccarioides]